MLEQHQQSRFPINFFFKKGTIAEKRWRQQHPVEPKKTSSGILRPLPEEQGPEWILGGKSDQQVIKARVMARKKSSEKVNDEKVKKTVAEEGLTDEERRDLEQYAAEEVFEAVTEVPEVYERDFERLERQPKKTLYCLVKRSATYHESSGRAERGWGLIGAGAPGIDPDGRPEGLHLV